MATTKQTAVSRSQCAGMEKSCDVTVLLPTESSEATP